MTKSSKQQRMTLKDQKDVCRSALKLLKRLTDCKVEVSVKPTSANWVCGWKSVIVLTTSLTHPAPASSVLRELKCWHVKVEVNVDFFTAAKNKTQQQKNLSLFFNCKWPFGNCFDKLWCLSTLCSLEVALWHLLLKNVEFAVKMQSCRWTVILPQLSL